MPYIKSFLIEKIKVEPSISDMKAFGLRYSKEEWEKLTKNSEFINIFTKNLKKAKEIADNYLNKNK